MGGLKRIVLDVLKPNEPSIIELSSRLETVKGVECVDITVKDTERKVEKVRIIIEGDQISFDKLKTILEEVGASIHGIDRVSCGKRLLTEAV